jgi:Bifunctional DNA primase/polymerase, N-terminal/Primase C terminal 1 (PriCT-1)
MIATALDVNLIDSISAAMQTNVPEVTGPDPNGEFSSPLEGALWMAAIYRIPQIPLNGKAPFFPEWPTKVSTDPSQIRAWWDQYHSNFGSLAVPGSHFIFETDSPAVRERFRAQGRDFTSKLTIESRQGEHRYYLSAPGVENVAQHAVEHGDFSIRADAQQCVSPGSIHPITGKQYRVVSSGPLSAPRPEEISFWESERKEKVPTIRDAQAMIRDGQRNSTLMSLAGKYLDLGEDPERVKERIQEINSERCSLPLSEDELTKTIFASIDRYAKNPDSITRKMKEIIPVLGSAGKAGSVEPTGRTMQFVRGDSIQPKRVRWLWRGRILADKLNVFSGEPDVGKGMTTVDLAAFDRCWRGHDAYSLRPDQRELHRHVRGGDCLPGSRPSVFGGDR